MPKNCISIFLCKSLIIGAFLLLSSCTTCTFSRSSDENISLQVPYVKGDETGDLTNCIIIALGTKANVHINQDSRYSVAIQILDDTKETIAYRFKHADKKNDLVSCENRICMLAQVDIIDTYTKKTFRGPGYIRGSAEYDHQHKVKSNHLNKESLGQLEDTSADREMIPVALNRDLANKIALWVQQQVDLMPIETSTTQ